MLLYPCLRYTIKLDSDDVQFGGHGRLDHDTEFFTKPQDFNGRANVLQVKDYFIQICPLMLMYRNVDGCEFEFALCQSFCFKTIK